MCVLSAHVGASKDPDPYVRRQCQHFKKTIHTKDGPNLHRITTGQLPRQITNWSPCHAGPVWSWETRPGVLFPISFRPESQFD
jgi:hypothetical protein